LPCLLGFALLGVDFALARLGFSLLRLLPLGERICNLFQSLRLGALLADILGLARLDEIELDRTPGGQALRIGQVIGQVGALTRAGGRSGPTARGIVCLGYRCSAHAACLSVCPCEHREAHSVHRR